MAFRSRRHVLIDHGQPKGQPACWPFAMAVLALLAFPIVPAAQSDLDAFMERVVARRDENWRKLQQYVLDEEEDFRVTGPGGTPIYGFSREYTWFIRQGFFIRSPLKADGVTVSEAERTAREADWIRRERAREEARAREGQGNTTPREPSLGEPPQAIEDVLKQTIEPQFVSAAYFMRFKFDPGHYALAGRERLANRDVLRIEYYPSKLFVQGPPKPDPRARERDAAMENKLNKVSLVTVWIDPGEHQIIKFTFDNMDAGFLPGRSLLRLDDLRAEMLMTQPFPNVWLPNSITMLARATMAIGSIEARYNVEYRNYRLADVTTRIKG